MLKGTLQWSVYPQRTGSIYRPLWQLIQSSPCMLVLILPTPGGWKAEWPLAGKKVTQIFNPRQGRESNWGPKDWEAEILTTAPTPLLSVSWNCFNQTIAGLQIQIFHTVLLLQSQQSQTNCTFVSDYLFCKSCVNKYCCCLKIIRDRKIQWCMLFPINKYPSVREPIRLMD